MANPAQNEYLQNRQKQILPLIGMPYAQLMMVFESISSDRHNIMFDRWGPSSTTPLDAEVLDIMTIKQMGDDDYSPSPYVCGGCDPAIPLLINETEFGKITSHVAPYIKRIWSTSRCSDEKLLNKAKLTEMPSVPWGGRRMSMQQKRNLLIQAAGRQMRGEIRASISRQWTDDFLWGRTQIWGPGIPKTGGVLDMGRNKNLFKKLEGEGWCNNNASRMGTLRSFSDHVFNESRDQRSYPNTYIFDSVAKAKFFKGVEFSVCDPCHNGTNPLVKRGLTRITFDMSRADTARGLQELDIQDDILGSNAEFYCIDEVKKECVLDGTGEATGQKIDVPVLPQGVVIAFNRFNHSPIGIQGLIQNDEVDAPLDLWIKSFQCKENCEGDTKFGIKMETSPLYFNRRENTIGMLFVAPDECPPPKHIAQCVTDFTCDPDGGKNLVAEARQAEALVANEMATAAVALASEKQSQSNVTSQRLAKAENKKGEK